VLLFAGTSSNVESEGFDRTSLDLPLGQNALIEAVISANPRTVVVLTTGAPVLMPWVDRVPSIVQAWFGGEQAGFAIADVLFGDVNPAGKLPVTFLKAWRDSPAFATYPGDGKTFYAEGVFVGYRHFDRNRIAPLFPFGHGLSYTTFSYANLSVRPRGVAGSRGCDISVDITNTGTRSGAEVVQFYVSEDHPSVPRPPKELKGFRKVLLGPGEKATVTATLDESAFSFFDPGTGAWRLNPGTFTIHTGSSSRDVRASAPVTIK
jgi:beta-glucosidase